MPAGVPPAPRRFLRRDAFLLAVFLFYWILPITYHALSHGKRMPGSPEWMYHLTNVSCLFLHATPAWPVEYVQILPAKDQEWITLSETEYSTMFVFGNRTRLSEIHRRGLDQFAYPELAPWLVQRYVELHPDRARPVALRLVRAHDVTGRETPRGHWRMPPLESIPNDERKVIFTYYPRPAPTGP